MRTIQKTFSIPETLATKLTLIAQELNQDESTLITEALLTYFEDYHDYKIAAKRSLERKKKGLRTISLEEVEKY